MQRHKIQFYNAHGETKYYSLLRVLERLFEGTPVVIEEVNTSNFAEKVGDDTIMLVIPGARAGQTYRDEFGRTHEGRRDLHSEQFKGTQFDHMVQAVERGMNVFGICAAGFTMAKTFIYTDYDPHTGEPVGVKDVTSEMGMLDVHAYGPDTRLYQAKLREAENPWTVYCAAHVAFTRLDGKRQHAHVAVSKGPSFVNLGTNCRPLVMFEDTGEAAIIRQDFGKGRVILSGPVPEVGGTNLTHYVHPRHREDPLCKDIVSKLEGSIDAWGELWLVVMDNLLHEPEAQELMPQVARNLNLALPPRKLAV